MDCCCKANNNNDKCVYTEPNQCAPKANAIVDMIQFPSNVDYICIKACNRVIYGFLDKRLVEMNAMILFYCVFVFAFHAHTEKV